MGLIASRLGKEVGQLELGTSVRSSELCKLIYTKFGADLALHTMQSLCIEAASNGEPPSAPTVPAMSETVAQFFELEDPVPPWRVESDQDRAERSSRESFGGWCG